MTAVINDIAGTGQFIFESGHHGDAWLDFDRLISDPVPLRRYCQNLAVRLRGHDADLLCGLLEDGAKA
jgi:orotate phosphoribosyltransferase